ncbi:MAG: ABC transporter ATP-binding protein [Candidatus Electrothrix aestuarii]|uniref:ABC transporter ATP-binding protein n=1 Tax=Candidatus Electrothrix aestuarii TaxID=3062594 RepID=A0AAU8LZL8_9BACT|nr:ABC transporter ATP-binding protein [Candidatus Electrothrix aestuarii]
MTHASASEPVVSLRDLRFTWPKRTAPVLDIEKLQAERGEQLFLMGPSGSGKTTLLGILGGIIRPQQGKVAVLGENIASLGRAAGDRFRADHIGFIFQMFNLIPYLSVIENVTLPCHFSRSRKETALRQSPDLGKEALRLLGHLRLDDPTLINKPVVELSVGQQQRVAAARALIGSPELLIADEPTSSLDSDHREAFIRLLFEECALAGTTLIFVSHDTSLAGLFHRTVKLQELNKAAAGRENLQGGGL